LCAINPVVQFSGWFSISGDRDLVLQQAQFYALKIEQQQAIALCAGVF
jgi:hypothetical protein